MRKGKIFNIIAWVTVIIAIAVNIYGRQKVTSEVLKEANLKSLVPEGNIFKKVEQPFLYLKTYDKESRLLGYVFDTKDVAPFERGYGGLIEILVALDRQGKITNLEILHHHETRKYAEGITRPEFLDQFKGKGPEDKFVIGQDLQGITHATISSNAIARALGISVRRMQEVIQKVRLAERKPRRPLNLNLDFYITVLIITFTLVAFYLKKTILKSAGLIVSMAYFGFIKANFICMANLGSILLLNLPDWRSNIAWYVFIFSALGLTFLLGTFYCTYICPFGGLQIFLNKILKVNVDISPGLADKLRKVKFILLWMLVILILLLNDANVADYEPFSTVFLARGTLAAWSIAAIILLLSLVHYRPFCNYFCAAGAFLDMLSRQGKKIFPGHDTKKR